MQLPPMLCSHGGACKIADSTGRRIQALRSNLDQSLISITAAPARQSRKSQPGPELIPTDGRRTHTGRPGSARAAMWAEKFAAAASQVCLGIAVLILAIIEMQHCVSLTCLCKGLCTA